MISLSPNTGLRVCTLSVSGAILNDCQVQGFCDFQGSPICSSARGQIVTGDMYAFCCTVSSFEELRVEMLVECLHRD